MRHRQILIRLSEEEKTILDRTAEAQGLATSSWARLQLLRASREYRNPRRMRVRERPNESTLLSLFCGPGGLDEGFRKAGFVTKIATDIDKDCVETFALNHPQTLVRPFDIRYLELSDLDKLVGERFCPVGVIGGPPCQSFSVSNVHQKDDDPRHELPECYAGLLSKLNSRHPISFFVFENVPGLLGTKHRHRYNKFKQLFVDAGFVIYETLLNARNYGVPQDRERVIIVGVNQKLHPDKLWNAPEPEKRQATVRDCIHGLPEPVYNSPGLDPRSFPVHPNHWCLVPRSSKFADAKLEEGQMYGRSFRTLCWDKPSWAVAYGHREVHVHPNGHRRLSIYEAMLLQTFPKTYQLTGNMSAQIRLVSEAVPVRLAWHIAKSVRESLDI